ncbi:hypothetical protein HZB90_02485 [archaeon]|nr:hypothetical protein [archaeon]
MDYAVASMLIWWLNILLLVAASCLSIVVVRLLFSKKHSKEIMLVKRVVFVLLSLAVLVLTLANLVNVAFRFVAVAWWLDNILFIAGYICFAAAFGYFWYSTAKMHQLHIKEPIFMLGVVCGVFIWLYYLFVLSIIPGTSGAGFGSRLLAYSPPILVSLMFILTLVVHPRMKAKIIRTPIWYISSGVFLYFIAYMIREYYVWNSSYNFIPVAYIALMLLSSFYLALGFFAAKKKFV